MSILSYMLCTLLLGSSQPVPVPVEKHDSTYHKRANIFLSKDEGDSWTQADTGLPPNVVITAWTTVSDGVIISTEDHGLYASHDGLKTWHTSGRGLPTNNTPGSLMAANQYTKVYPHLKVKTLVTHKQSVYAGSYLQGVYVSHDEGSSWQPCSEGLGEATSVRCLYSLNNIHYAGTDTGIYRSTDDGQHWSLVTQGMQVNDFTSWNNTIYAATNQGVLRSGSRQHWVWSWRTQALFNISAADGVVYAVLPNDEIYTCPSGSDQGMTLLSPFNQYTFRMTPASPPVLRAPLRKSFRSLREQGVFNGAGLPKDMPFNKVLRTPFGILIACRTHGLLSQKPSPLRGTAFSTYSSETE